MYNQRRGGVFFVVELLVRRLLRRDNDRPEGHGWTDKVQTILTRRPHGPLDRNARLASQSGSRRRIGRIVLRLDAPYVLTIVVVATWGVPPLEPPDEQTFRAIYFLRLVLGNVLGLTVGAGTAAAAASFGL
jgi:hypothetical protein